MSTTSTTPVLVSAGYDLIVSFTPIFENQSDFPRIQKIPTANSQVNRIVISDDNKIALALNPYIFIYDIGKSTKASQYSGHISNVTDLVFSTDTFYTSSEDRTIQFWDRRQGSIRSQKTISTTSPLNGICLHPSNNCLITCNEKGSLEQWDVRTQSLTHSLRISSLPIRSISQSRDGLKIVCGCQDGNVVIVSNDGTKFTEVHKFKAHDDVILRCALSPNEQTFVTTSADSTAKLWNFSDYSHKFTLTDATQKKWVWDAAFTSDSRHVVTGGTDKTYRTWDVESGAKVYSNESAHTKGITAVAILDFPKK